MVGVKRRKILAEIGSARELAESRA